MWKVGDGRNIKVCTYRCLVYIEDLVRQLEINYVFDLVLLGTIAWNKPLVEFVCCPPTTRAILATPLSMVPQQDTFYWPMTLDGHYTTKTRYQFSCMASDSSMDRLLMCSLCLVLVGRSFGRHQLFLGSVRLDGELAEAFYRFVQFFMLMVL